MRHILHGYRNNGFSTAMGISLFLAAIFFVVAITSDNNYLIFGHLWMTGPPFGVCLAVAKSRAVAKVNADILNPKGMNLQKRCGSHGYAAQIEMVNGCCSNGNVGAPLRSPGGNAIDVVGELEEKSHQHCVSGRRERERAPANFGTVELTNSSKNDVAADVVQSLYSHIIDGIARSKHIVECNLKIVYVPEKDLFDLAQVYNSKEMGELRVQSKSEDGARRVLRFFCNNGSSLAVGGDHC
jgi:hypothetical protein